MKKIILFLICLNIIFIPLNVKAASSSAVLDIDSGRTLLCNNCHEKRLIASITKIMTAVLALENGDVNREITVGEEVLKMYGSNIYLEYKEKITLKDLLYGLILRSGNDAAVVIANNISKNEKEFVRLMNKKAHEIGMKDTIFRNPHGLDEETENYSTAYDMALLSNYAQKNFKLYRKISKTKEYETNTGAKSYLWYNRNDFLKTYKYATGGKTGYTPRAGKTLVTTANKDNFKISTVSLNDSDMYNNHENIDNTIFKNYANYKIIDKNTISLNDPFYKDKLYVKEDFYYPLTEIEASKVKTILKVEKKKYKNNDKVGVYEVYLGDEILKRIDVYVKEKEKKNFFSRLFS